MFVMSCFTALRSRTVSTVLLTLTLSPVRMAWSTRRLVDVTESNRQSAGILSPTATEMISPGTSSVACVRVHSPSRKTLASSGEYSFKACTIVRIQETEVQSMGGLTSMAFSALVSWITPTVALATRMRRMTRGSTNALHQVDPSESSKRARTNETTAEARRMRTSWSLNCSRMSSHSGVGGSSGSSADRSENGGHNLATGSGRTVFTVKLSMFRSGSRRQTLGAVHRIVLQHLFRGCGPGSFHVAGPVISACKGAASREEKPRERWRRVGAFWNLWRRGPRLRAGINPGRSLTDDVAHSPASLSPFPGCHQGGKTPPLPVHSSLRFPSP